jgi:hypothetical protein
VAKKKGDIDITVPSADLGLKELPVKYDDFQDAFEKWMLTRDREQLRRAEFRYIFLKAKDAGLASTGELWGRQPVPQKAGAPEVRRKQYELLKPMLIELMAEEAVPNLMRAARKAVKLGCVEGHGTPDSLARRLVRRFDRKKMKESAQALRKKL